MSKASLAMFAALGAGGAAAVTAAIYSLSSSGSKKAETATTQTSSNTTKTTITANSSKLSPFASPVPVSTTTATTKAIATAESSPVNPAGLFEYGFPGPVSDIAARSALISSYDRRMRNPHWVVEHITPESLARRDADRRHSSFAEDHEVPARFRALLRDYYRSGYDRGHQVPAADAKWSQRAIDDTFYLSNMCPQVGEGFNRDYWSHLEDFCRRLTVRYPSVRIVTGPLYLPRRDPDDGRWYVKYEMIGSPPNVAVPTHFYKVIFAEEDGSRGPGSGPVALGAFVLPNAPIDNDKPLTDFEVPVEAVERASGLEFASKLPAHRRRSLCADTTCALVIKDYADRQKAFAKQPRGSSTSSLPPPKA